MEQSSKKSLSKFEQKQKRRQAEIDARVAEYKAVLSKLTDEQLEQHRNDADIVIAELESGRKLDRIIAHIDMDAFFASVEIRESPELASKPLAVGNKWMLSTANYAARKFGVRSGMPGFQAQKLCTELVIVPVNMTKYGAASLEVRRVLERYDANLHHSMDEAYLDLTDYIQRRISEEQLTFNDKGELSAAGPSASTVASTGWVTAQGVQLTAYDRFVAHCVAEIRAQVLAETRLTCSSGIAPNCMLAKLCTDMNKPNGQFYLPPQRDCLIKFIRQQRVGKVCGIGPVSERTLNGLDVTLIGHLFERRADLHALFADPRQRARTTGSSWSPFEFYMRVTLALGSTQVDGCVNERKSLSVEHTFAPTDCIDKLCATLRDECDDVLLELREKRLRGRTVTVKIKFDSFDVVTRGQTIDTPFGPSERPSGDAETDEKQKTRLLAVAETLLRAELARRPGVSVRLLGLRISNLFSGCEEQPDSHVGNSQPRITDLFGSAAGKRHFSKSVPEGATDDECSNSNLLPPVVVLDDDADSRSRFDILDDSNSRYFQVSDDDTNAVTAVTGQTHQTAPAAVCPPETAQREPASSVNATKLYCPVCHAAIRTDYQLVLFNQHVDECLNNTNTSPHPSPSRPTSASRPQSAATGTSDTLTASAQKLRTTPNRVRKRVSKPSLGKRPALTGGGPLDKFFIPCIEIGSDSD